MKGQAAIEYMAVIGMALVMAAPFVVHAQASILDIRSSSSIISAQDTLNDMDVAIRTVDAAGEPAARTFEIRIPGNLNRTSVEQNRVLIALNTPDGVRELYRTFEADLTGSLPSEPGLYLLRARAEDGEVNIEVVS